MKNAIWFSRHPATEEQLAEIKEMGFQLLGDSGILPMMTMSPENLPAIVSGLEKSIVSRDAHAVFGVFAAPLQNQLHHTAEAAVMRGDWLSADVPCFAAWNITRPVEGGKPTFHHHRFLHVGNLHVHGAVRTISEGWTA